ncbi:MAG: hypothetical protein RM022_029295 [Nostoc sp. EfeVER01]|uniref:hypothetical protein n=1 Tax=unclassified Nostoc TaxID=2593658 RepID=UPI002AD2417E|nr:MULTISPECIES: hypothetical protein [unclassified Nostoc]MDZ7945030.1 hypothetical protein [Nostoc sp. EfeVER01]MDZ7991627.1 hypothetical protein [Nostoc sp. EspVER01]
MSKDKKITQVLQCAIAYGGRNAIANTICFSRNVGFEYLNIAIFFAILPTQRRLYFHNTHTSPLEEL